MCSPRRNDRIIEGLESIARKSEEGVVKWTFDMYSKCKEINEQAYNEILLLLINSFKAEFDILCFDIFDTQNDRDHNEYDDKMFAVKKEFFIGKIDIIKLLKIKRNEYNAKG